MGTEGHLRAGCPGRSGGSVGEGQPEGVAVELRLDRVQPIEQICRVRRTEPPMLRAAHLAQVQALPASGLHAADTAPAGLVAPARRDPLRPAVGAHGSRAVLQVDVARVVGENGRPRRRPRSTGSSPGTRPVSDRLQTSQRRLLTVISRYLSAMGRPCCTHSSRKHIRNRACTAEGPLFAGRKVFDERLRRPGAGLYGPAVPAAGRSRRPRPSRPVARRPDSSSCSPPTQGWSRT